MITTNLSPLGIVWNIAIDGVPFNKKTVQRVQTSFVENQHDYLSVELVGVPSSYVSSYVDRPITMSVQINGGKSFSFYGYVTQIESISSTNEGTVNNSPFQIIRLICLGSSHLLRSNNTLVWENVTLENVVSDIANDFRLGYSMPVDTYVFKRLVQSEESLWKLLVKACNQLGYVITLINSHIHIWDKNKSLARQPSYTILRGIKVKRNNYSPLPGDIVNIETTLGTADVSQQFGDKTVSYIDERGVFVTVDSSQLNGLNSFGTPAESRFYNKLTVSVDSFEKASRYIESKIKNAYPYMADALVFGDPSIVPGGVVKVEGYGGDFDGYWYVNSVTHTLSTDTLLSSLKLEKDGTYDVLPKFPVVQRYLEAPLPTLINNKWVMKAEYVNVYN